MSSSCPTTSANMNAAPSKKVLSVRPGANNSTSLGTSQRSNPVGSAPTTTAASANSSAALKVSSSSITSNGHRQPTSSQNLTSGTKAMGNTQPSTTRSSIPFSKDDEKHREYYQYYEKLATLVSRRKQEDKPRILIMTDVEHDYDDLLAIIFLAEMQRMGAIELAGFIANHQPSVKRAKFVRTVLHLLGLPDVPVAEGTDGVESQSLHNADLFYGLKNMTFENAPWNRSFESGAKLMERLVDPNRPLTVLNIASLKDTGMFFDRHKADPGFLQKGFRKFVSQGGYQVGQKVKQNKVEVALSPIMDMMNNKFHPSQAKNYCDTLADLKLPSDAWSREAAKSARLSGTFMKELFKYGPIGKHLEWQWMRNEFKFYWDPFNWPFQPFLQKDWYLSTRLGLDKNSEQFKKLINTNLPFDVAAPMIKVIAYDCCAAVGAVGDDFMQAMGILAPEAQLPPYNRVPQKHRVFGRGPGDLGGVNAPKLAKVMEAFLLGGLTATYNSPTAGKMKGFEKLEYKYATSPFQLKPFLDDILPLMKNISDREAKAEKYKADAADAKKAGNLPEYQRLVKMEQEARDAARAFGADLSRVQGVNKNKLPTRDDIPYELLYQDAMKKVAQSKTAQPN